MSKTMVICSKCGCQLVLINWIWKDRLGHETCVHDEAHDPVERSRK